MSKLKESVAEFAETTGNTVVPQRPECEAIVPEAQISHAQPRMSDKQERKTYTQRLSDEIDAAHGAYQAGDPDALGRLHEAFRLQAANVIAWRFRQAARTLEYDIAHRAISRLETFQNGSKLSTWFYRIAHREVSRALKVYVEDRNRSVPLGTEVAEDGEEGDQSGSEHLEADKLEAKPSHYETEFELDELLRLAKLPEKQAEVLQLIKEGYSLDEIAEKTGIARGTIAGRYRLAKEKARKLSQHKDEAKRVKRVLQKPHSDASI